MEIEIEHPFGYAIVREDSLFRYTVTAVSFGTSQSPWKEAPK